MTHPDLALEHNTPGDSIALSSGVPPVTRTRPIDLDGKVRRRRRFRLARRPILAMECLIPVAARFGIVTPTLNGDRFIEQMLRSIWDQRDDEVEIHHVIVGGGWTDRAAETASGYPSGSGPSQRCRLLRAGPRTRPQAKDEPYHAGG
jgi:hypothetical protein